MPLNESEKPGPTSPENERNLATDPVPPNSPSSDRPIPGQIAKILAWPLIGLIYLYRFTLSPFIGNQCRFQPTCSQYALDAVRIYGAFKGTVMAIRRLSRCHPWHEGGYDPVE